MASEKSNTSGANVSAIDKALQAAKARKAAREGVAIPEGSTKTGGPAPTTKQSKPRQTDEEKAAKQLARDKESAEKKAARAAERDRKRAEKEANKKPAHIAKVMRAAEKLPRLGQAAVLLLNEAVGGLSATDLSALALHIQHHNRSEATKRSLSSKLEAGMRVTITGGSDPRFIGLEGTVTKAQRIHAYVAVDGFKKDAYVYNGDVTPVPAAKSSASA